MKTALTGTPGTGKTTIGKILRDRYGLKVVDLNEVIRAHQYYAGRDENRDCLIVDLEALKAHPFSEDLVLEGHLSHNLLVDRVIVLRTNPVALRRRLQQKAFSDKKINENVEAEILDVILVEAFAQHGTQCVRSRFDRCAERISTTRLGNHTRTRARAIRRWPMRLDCLFE